MSNKATFQQRFPGLTSILRNGALLTGTQWAETGLRAVYAVLIGRLLGPELYGVWSFALATYAFAIGFTHFGLESLIPLRLGRDRQAGAFLSTTFAVRLVLVLFATAVVATQVIALEPDTYSRTALLIVLPALIGRGIVLWARTVFLGLERSQTAFRLAFSFRLLEVIAGLFCLWLGAGLYALLAIHATAWLVEAVMAFVSISRQVPVKLGLDRPELHGMLRRGSILGLGTIGLAALVSIPVILTRYVLDDLAVVGQIAMAMQVASLVVMPVQGVLSAALPVVSRATANEDPRLRFYSVLIGLGVAVIFGIGFLLAQAFGPSIFTWLLGDQFVLAGTLLAPALLAAGIMIAPTGIWQLLVTKDRIWSGVFAGWLGALTLILLLPPLVQSLGPSGALYAAAIGWGVRAIILIGWALFPVMISQK